MSNKMLSKAGQNFPKAFQEFQNFSKIPQFSKNHIESVIINKNFVLYKDNFIFSIVPAINIIQSINVSSMHISGSFKLLMHFSLPELFIQTHLTKRIIIIHYRSNLFSSIIFQLLQKRLLTLKGLSTFDS